MTTAGSVRIICPHCGRPIDVPISLSLALERADDGSVVAKLTADTAVIRQHIATWHPGPGGPGEPLPLPVAA